MVIFIKKFGTLDPHLPIVWDKVPNKRFFFDTFPYLKLKKDNNLPFSFQNWILYPLLRNIWTAP